MTGASPLAVYSSTTDYIFIYSFLSRSLNSAYTFFIFCKHTFIGHQVRPDVFPCSWRLGVMKRSRATLSRVTEWYLASLCKHVDVSFLNPVPRFLLWMLCISTSKRVLRMPFAGRNRLSNAKITFSFTTGTKWTKKWTNNDKIRVNQHLGANQF